MTKFFGLVQAGPVVTGTGGVTTTCAATQVGTPLVAIIPSQDMGAITPPANWRWGGQVGQSSNGQVNVFFLEGKNNPGGLQSAAFTGTSGKSYSGSMAEFSLPAGYNIALDAVGASNGTNGTNLSVASTNGNAPDDMIIWAAADFFASAVTGSWTTLPGNVTTLQTRAGSAATQWSWGTVLDATQGLHSFAAGFTPSSGSDQGWCSLMLAFRAVRLATMGMAGGERTEMVCLSPDSRVMIAAGDVEGIWRTCDPLLGDHWQVSMTNAYGGGWNNVATLAWSVMPGEPNSSTVYAGVGSSGNNGGFMASTDGGYSWTMRSTAVQYLGNVSGQPPKPSAEGDGDDRWVGNNLICQDPVNGYIYSIDVNSGVKRSSNLGTTWTTISSGLGSPAFARAIINNPSNPKELWCACWSTNTSNGGIFHCADGTAATPSWKQLTGYTGTVSDMVILGGWLYAACNAGGVYRTPVSSLTLGGASGTSLFGATVIAAGYPPATDKVSAIPLFDSYLDVVNGSSSKYPLGTLKANWYGLGYLGEGAVASSWPTTSTQLRNNQGELFSLITAYPSLQFQYSLSPSRSAVLAGGSTLTAEKNALAAYLTLLKNTGGKTAVYEICLWHESNDNGKNLFADVPGTTGQPTYQAYWNAYAPVVQAAGMLCVPCFLISDPKQNVINAINMLPDGNSSCYPDRVYVDWYAAGGFGAGGPKGGTAAQWNAYTGGFNPDMQINGVSVITKANAIKKPVGLCEFGAAINSPLLDSAPVYGQPSTYPGWTAYMSYMINLFTGNAATAGPQPAKVCDFAMYTGQNPNAPNDISAPSGGNPTDYKIPDLVRGYTALSSSGGTTSGTLVSLNGTFAGLTYAGTLCNGIDGFINAAGNTVLIVGASGGAGGKNPYNPGGGAHNQAILKMVIPSTYPTTGSITYIDLINQAGSSINVTTIPPDGRTWWKTGAFADYLGGGAFTDPRVLVDPNNNQAIYVSGPGGVFRSYDGGLTWATAINGMTQVQFFDMAFDPSNPSHAVMAGDDYAHADISGDLTAMASGSITPEGLGGGLESHAVAIDPLDSTVFAGSNTKYGKSTGGGVQARKGAAGSPFTEIGFTAAGGGAAVTGLYAGRDASNNRFVLAIAQGGGMFRATMAASGNPVTGTWTWAATQGSGPSISTKGSQGQHLPFASKSGTSATIYVFDRNQGIFRSTDYGVTWTLIWNGVSSGSINSGWLALNPSVPGELWISSSNNPNGLYKMSMAGSGIVGQAGGPTVTAITASQVANPGGLAFYNGVLYVAALNGSANPSVHIYQSSDGGNTWTDAGSEVGSYVSDPRWMFITQNGTLMFATDYNGYIVGSVAGAVAQPLTINTSSLPAATIGTAYTATATAINGKTPYTWSVVAGSGSLPAGLSLNSSTGVISGTPSGTAGNSIFKLQVTDSSSPVQTAQSGTLTISVTSTPVLTITTASLPDGAIGTSYSQTLHAQNGTTPYTWALGAGSSLPAGLSLNTSTGVISGTPTTAGNVAFSVTVTDSSTPTPQQATASLSINIPAVVPTLSVPNQTLPSGVTGQGYSGGVQALNGTLPYTWAQIAGTLPAGISFNSDGSVTGTPTGSGTTTFTAQATDSSTPAQVASGTITITIAAAQLTIITQSLPNGEFDVPYDQFLQAQNGVPPYRWSIVSGQLPAGLSLNPDTGEITGTPLPPP